MINNKKGYSLQWQINLAYIKLWTFINNMIVNKGNMFYPYCNTNK